MQQLFEVLLVPYCRKYGGTQNYSGKPLKTPAGNKDHEASLFFLVPSKSWYKIALIRDLVQGGSEFVSVLNRL